MKVFDQEKQQQTIITVLNKFQSNVLSKDDQLEKSFKTLCFNLLYKYFYYNNISFLGVIHGDLSFNNVIVNDNKIFGIIDMGDVVYSYTFLEFAVALCYLILHEFEDDSGKLCNVQIKSFVDAYEKHYRKLNDLELSMIHVIIQILK